MLPPASVLNSMRKISEATSLHNTSGMSKMMMESNQLSLEARLDKQTLLLQTLLMILLEKKVIFEDEFKEWMDYVDELDGKRDGKLQEDKTPRSCPSCGRNSARHQAKCQYCGHELPVDFLHHRPQT